ITLTTGPFGIESQRDSDSVILPMLELMKSRADASAFVIACYSDPGIDAAKAEIPVPVFGIQEAGTATALCRADMFGVIAIGQPSILRHRKYMRRMGVLDRLAGERALNMSVDETARGENTFRRLTDVGADLINDGAACLILGCAGMAKHRAPLEQKLGVPVIDPTQAAVAMAHGTVLASSL
ncbi:MAG: aspartate/glutamate racemase family protein, partial [Planktotalea sp.]|uniref:aspartate/glutamate racemase family protein n=1 Tax=Planktotalea sp. TaxID=2029877 RepID=UPI003C7367F8